MMVLITGASGFVGEGFVNHATANSDLMLRAAVRKNVHVFPKKVQTVVVANISRETNWRYAVCGVDAIVHAAAKVHVMRDSAADSLAEYRRINVDGTQALAQQAVEAGVKRFIFISSIKVNGESTLPGCAFTADDTPAPADPYAMSKFEAEQKLTEIANRTGLEVVIIRPVLVYGPGVKANFHFMMRWINRGYPLPFGAIDNRRSLVARDNLVDLILTCLRHPNAANQIFLVSDGEDISTTMLLRKTAVALGKPGWLIPVPPQVLLGCARIFGKANFVERLVGSLQVDISKTRNLLGWEPKIGLDEALRQTARHFLTAG